MIALIVLSLVVSFATAFMVSIGFGFISPNYAFAAFWFTLAFEWIFMEPVNRILRKRSIKEQGKTFDKLAKYEMAVGKQLIVLECEYCGEKNHCKVSLNEENKFTCKSCKNENKIIMQFATVRTSNPLELVPQTDISAIPELNDDDE